MKKILSYTAYWVVQCTWGALMTLTGALAALYFLAAGYKPKTYGPAVYFEFGSHWGGLNLGGFFFCNKNSSTSTKAHEFGHSIQNLIFGPLMPFLVSIPSAARYWLFRIGTHEKRTMYTASLFLFPVIIFTLLAWLMTFTHVKALVIICEVFRLYTLILTLWLRIFQVPKFINNRPGYYDIWFEAQANTFGKKYAKKEA